MEKLFTQIADLIAVEIDEVKDVEYLDKKLGNMLIISTTDDKKYVLTLLELTPPNKN